MRTKISLGEILRNAREEMDITQAEVAKKLGCSAKMLSNYELDKRQPDLSTLAKICDYYKLSIDYLVGRTDDTSKIYHIDLNNRQKELLKHFDMLPEKYQNDILRITKLHVLAKDKKDIEK